MESPKIMILPEARHLLAIKAKIINNYQNTAKGKTKPGPDLYEYIDSLLGQKNDAYIAVLDDQISTMTEHIVLTSKEWAIVGQCKNFHSPEFHRRKVILYLRAIVCFENAAARKLDQERQAAARQFETENEQAS